MKINSIINIGLNKEKCFRKRILNKFSDDGNFNLPKKTYPKNYYLNRVLFGNKLKMFNSIDEANKYFFDNYGAISDFGTIEQAQTFDYAFKDFLSKTKIAGNKFLDGIEIASCDRDDDSCIKIAAQVQKQYNFDDNKELGQLAESYKEQDRFDEFLNEFNPKAVDCLIIRLGLMLNNKKDWGLKKLEANKDKIQNLLVVVLHLKNSPFDYVVQNKIIPNENEAEIMAEITENKNKNDFVEKYILKRLKGEVVSKDATKLYREFGGPNIFGDWVDYDFAGVRFSTLEEANKYFMDEYGIKAKFTDLEQAYVVKCAIDDFLKLDTIKNKKFLEGISIKIKDKMDGDSPDARAEVALDGYEFVYIKDMSELYKKYQRENRTSDFFVENRPDKVNVKKITVFMKSGFDWKAKPKGKLYMADASRSSIYHEIGHILHLRANPYMYIMGIEDNSTSKTEYEIMKKVSDYATKNRLEFVAEYIANRMMGKTFDDDVNELYKSFGGPDIF